MEAALKYYTMTSGQGRWGYSSVDKITNNPGHLLLLRTGLTFWLKETCQFYMIMVVYHHLFSVLETNYVKGDIWNRREWIWVMELVNGRKTNSQRVSQASSRWWQASCILTTVLPAGTGDGAKDRLVIEPVITRRTQCFQLVTNNSKLPPKAKTQAKSKRPGKLGLFYASLKNVCRIYFSGYPYMQHQSGKKSLDVEPIK